MSDPLFLSGAIPGLLRRCAPVVHRYGNAGLVLSVDDGTWGDRKRAPTAVVCPDTSNSGGRYEVAPLPLADVALDLRDPAGRDIAARWVAAYALLDRRRRSRPDAAAAMRKLRAKRRKERERKEAA